MTGKKKTMDGGIFGIIPNQPKYYPESVTNKTELIQANFKTTAFKLFTHIFLFKFLIAIFLLCINDYCC